MKYRTSAVLCALLMGPPSPVLAGEALPVPERHPDQREQRSREELREELKRLQETPGPKVAELKGKYAKIAFFAIKPDSQAWKELRRDARLLGALRHPDAEALLVDWFVRIMQRETGREADYQKAASGLTPAVIVFREIRSRQPRVLDVILERWPYATLHYATVWGIYIRTVYGGDPEVLTKMANLMAAAPNDEVRQFWRTKILQLAPLPSREKERR